MIRRILNGNDPRPVASYFHYRRSQQPASQYREEHESLLQTPSSIKYMNHARFLKYWTRCAITDMEKRTPPIHAMGSDGLV